MKKQLLLILLMLLPLLAKAQDIGVKNANGVTIYYNFTNSGTALQVTCYGNYYNSSAYKGKVVIPDKVTYDKKIYKVTSIGNNAFWGSPITSVTIPNSVTSIGESAFYNCYKLTLVKIPNSVTSIGESAFADCAVLTSVTIPKGVISIGRSAFADCYRLTSVAIPNSVTSIGGRVFWNCSNLTSVIISNSVTSIEDETFAKCSSLTSVVIPNSVTCIGESAFEYCSSLASVIIPKSVTKVDRFAFRGCSGRISVTIPDSGISIGSEAFPSTAKFINKDESTIENAPLLTNKQPVNANQIPNLVVQPNSIAFTDAAGTNAIVGGRNSTITLEVKNTGKGAAYNCLAKINSKGSNLGIETKSVKIGFIAAGEIKKIELPIVAGMNTQDGQVEFAIQVDEPNGFGTDPQYLTVKTKSFEAPMVKITDYSLTGNGGTTLKKKQPFDLQLMLQNIKYGLAEDVSVSIEIPQNVLMFDGSQQQKFANMNGGEAKSLVYSLIVNNNYQGSTIPIKVHVKEKYGKYAEDRIINLTLDQALASTKIDVKASQSQPQNDIQIAFIGSDVDKELPQAATQQQNTFVVIIANEHYMTVDGVPFANNDGVIFDEYCRQTLGIPKDNIRLVKDATFNAMRHQLDWLRKVMETFNGRASAIVYYAGHGVPDEHSHASFLLPADGYPTNMNSAYSLDELYQMLGNMPAKSIMVFLDACFSGSKRGEGMIASARGVALKAKQSAPKGNMVVFSAAQNDETAYPYKEQEHGMFTYYLLKKLKESKGETTLGDLADYITQSVKERSIVKHSKSQTPAVSASAKMATSWREMKLK